MVLAYIDSLTDTFISVTVDFFFQEARHSVALVVAPAPLVTQAEQSVVIRHGLHAYHPGGHL